MVKKAYIKPSAIAYRIQSANIMAGSGKYSEIRGGGPTDSFGAKGNNDTDWD